MSKEKFKIKHLVLLLVFVAIALGVQNRSILLEKSALRLYDNSNVITKIFKFQSILLKKEKEILYEFDVIIYNLKKKNKENIFAYLYNNLRKKDYSLLLFHNNRLVNWYGENISNEPSLLNKITRSNFIKAKNNTYYTTIFTTYKNYTVVGLLPIKHNYDFENEYVKNSYSDIFQGYDNYLIGIRGYKIFNTKNHYLFSLKINKNIKRPVDLFYYLLLLLQSLLFISVIILIYSIFIRIFYKYRKISFIFIYALVIVLNRVGMYYGIKDSLLWKYQNGVDTVALLNLIFDLISIYAIAKVFNEEMGTAISAIVNKTKKNAVALLYLIFSVSIYYYLLLVLEYFITDKTILVPLQNIYTMSFQSIIIYIVIILKFFIFIRAFYTALKYLKDTVYWSNIVIYLIITIFIYSILLYNQLVFVPAIIFLIVVSVQLTIISYRKSTIPLYSILLLIIELSIIFTIFTQYLFISKNHTVKIELLSKLTVKSDPIVEKKLVAISTQINDDVQFQSLLASTNNQFEIPKYLMRKYFTLLTDKYDVQITPCYKDEELYLIEDSVQISCFDFFRGKFKIPNKRVENSNFIFLDNNNGRTSYFGNFNFLINNVEYGIFIDIDSKILNSDIGYPQVLTHNTSTIEKKLKKFSYAKYYKGVITEQSGVYNYENYLDYYVDEKFDGFLYLSKDGFSHIALSKNDTTVIISELDSNVITFVIELAYVFVFFILLLLITTFNKLKIKNTLNSDLQHKILLSLTGTILFVLFVLISFIIYNIIVEYKHDQKREFTKNIIHATYFVKEEVINNNLNIDVIEYRLHLLTEMIKSDINIFNANGDLLVSSRPEISEKGFVGDKINPVAYYNLIHKDKTTYIADEKIGTLEYKSTYATILNNSNRVNYIINIPNFKSNNELENSISKLIGLAINSLLLITLLSVLIIFLIFRKVLKPLHELRLELSSVDINKGLNKINYKYDDEIGALVGEYNKKIEELRKNTKLLTDVERQNAWKNVSRQVAHEIKNPLTPMKLNIQFLQRAYSQNHDEFERIFKNTTNNLIEHINTLSNLASSFSSFAKMPNLIFKDFNVVTSIDNAINLFNKEKKVNIIKHFDENKDIIINTDPEQLQRVFTNIIKNAIQAAIEKDIEINIFLMEEKNDIVIAIQDNGKGISEDQKEKIFTPNFTTKTSGMGIGLTIVKNIVEKSKGEIWFKSKVNQGTTFFIKLPLKI